MRKSLQRRNGRTEYERVQDHISNGRPATLAKLAKGSSNTWGNPKSETLRASARPGARLSEL